MPFRFGVIVGIAVSCSASAADDFQDWTAAVQANEDHAARVIGSFRIQSTNDFLRVSDTIREANAKLGVNVDLPVIEIMEVDVRGRWMLRKWKNRKGTECVTGQNSKYVFDIEKAAGGSSYTITRLEYRSLNKACDDAKDGTVLAVAEKLAMIQGRKLIQQTLQTSLELQARAIEKKVK